MESTETTIPMHVRPLSEIDSMDGYFGSYGGLLGKKAIDALAPLHVPTRDPLPYFDHLARQPFPCQQHAIAAITKMLCEVGSGFLCGEMGTGKTLMGIVGVDTHARQSRNNGGKGGKYRALVLCPDHLIDKWCREIGTETLPWAKVARFGKPGDGVEDDDEVQAKKKRKKKGADIGSGTRRTLRDFVALINKGGHSKRKGYGGKGWERPDGAEWYVLGRNQAKWLSNWIGLDDRTTGFNGVESENCLSSKYVVVDSVADKDEYGTVTGRKQVYGRAFVCPKCGTLVTDKKGIPVDPKTMSAKTKGSSQKRCLGTYAVEIADGDKPRAEGLDRLCPIPSRFKDKKPADLKTGRRAEEFTQGGRRYKVVSCNEPLFNYVSKPVRWSPARIAQKKLRGFFDYLVIDEVHEQKSDESAQSMACGKLISSVKHVLALTGTIIGGYADHLYPLMMRITPKSLREEGYEWGKSMAFSEVYGRIDRVVKTTEDAEVAIGGSVGSMRRAKSGNQKEKKYVRPGVMPTMFGRHMIGSCLFVTLEELDENLPNLFEYVGGKLGDEPDRDAFDAPGRSEEEAQELYEHALDLHERAEDGWHDTAVDMLPNQAAEYKRVSSAIERENTELLKKGSMKLLGAYLHTTTDYPDKPFGWGHDKEVKKAIVENGGKAAPALLGQSFLRRFNHEFDSASESLVLTKVKDGKVETDRVPLIKEGGVYWIEVELNGFKKKLVYDTGASSISIPETMADDIGLTDCDGDSEVIMRVADGSTHSAKKTHIQSVKAGKFEIENVECVVVPIGGLPHTIGYWNLPDNKKIENWVGVVTPRDLPEDATYPKEQALIDICKKQKADSRQTWVYLNMTGKRNIQPRLKKLLEAEGLKVGILRANDVQPIEREAWIAKHGREFDVMISHPQLVSTGLDLFSKAEGGHNYSTLVFYETGYNLFTMRQAARRAWRIGQPHDCRVYYLYYKETMQHRAMNLMSRKLSAAQALEGEFSEDGLAAMAGEDNVQMEMAKRLADQISDSDMQRSWSKLNSSPKKALKRPLDALKKDGPIEPSPFDGLPAGLQLAGEALSEAVARQKEIDDLEFADDDEDVEFVEPILTPEAIAKMFAKLHSDEDWDDKEFD